MHEPFLDSSTFEGQGRVREYVLAWLERLDYQGKLDRSWPADDLGSLVWQRVAREFADVWEGPVVTNAPLAEVAAAALVEDYFAAYPDPRGSRYAVAGPLTDAGFRRCVLDFVHDLEEFEPAALSPDPEAVAAEFWRDVREHPDRWGYTPHQGPFVDDEEQAHAIALATIRDYFRLMQRVTELREEA